MLSTFVTSVNIFQNSVLKKSFFKTISYFLLTVQKNNPVYGDNAQNTGLLEHNNRHLLQQNPGIICRVLLCHGSAQNVRMLLFHTCSHLLIYSKIITYFSIAKRTDLMDVMAIQFTSADVMRYIINVFNRLLMIDGLSLKNFKH